MKYFGVFALIVVVGLSVVSGRNATYGEYKPGDEVLDRRVVFRSPKLAQVVSADLRYGYIKGNRNRISLIKVVDQAKKDGGKVSLVSGGPGATNATLHFKSKRGKGLSYVVVFYGKNATRIH